jgi:hypothetical protein
MQETMMDNSLKHFGGRNEITSSRRVRSLKNRILAMLAANG